MVIYYTYMELEAGTNKKQWFRHKDYTSFQIQKHRSISEHEIIASVTINDVSAVRNLMNKIEKLPAEGEMFKSFGDDVEHIDIVFICAHNTQTIEIYNHMFKTPSTAFNGLDNQDQISLYKEIADYLA